MTRCTRPLLLLLALLFSSPAGLTAQTIKVTATDLPRHLALHLPEGDYDTQAAYALVNTQDSATRLPAQVAHAWQADGTLDSDSYQLLVSVPNQQKGGVTGSYRLEKLTDPPAAAFSWEKSDLTLKLSELGSGASDARPVWQYNYGTIVKESVPESEPRRSRSCYVHPVWGMHGEILSDDFPKDHYHHHGIFWTWPYVGVGDKTYDLWMSTDIRQKFHKWLVTETGPVAARLGVENDWMVGAQRVATERVWLTTYRSDADSRAIDLTIFIQAADLPVALQGREMKSYGGLTFRYDVTPRKDGTVRVPGKSLGFGFPAAGSPDLVNTPLPWADLTTQIPGAPQRSGVAIFIHPQHPDYPPTWLTRTYGALCVGWPGIERHQIPAGKSIALQYRVWVHGSELDPQQLAQQYDAYVLKDE